MYAAFVLLTMAAGPAERAAKAELEAIAARVAFLEYYEFFGSTADALDAKHKETPHFRLVRPVWTKAHPEAALVPLLKHRDPRVRTLAVLALFQHENPQHLPLFAEMTKDKARTIVDMPRSYGGYGLGAKSRTVAQPRTVGGVATQALEAYLSLVEPREPFADYWAARKGRDHCAAWLGVRVRRASGGWSPGRDATPDAVTALVDDALGRRPDAERVLTLFWLEDAIGRGSWPAEADIVAECERIGPAFVRSLLRGERLSDDPDLSPKGRFHEVYAVRSLLNEAARLLAPEDAGWLLERARKQRSASWYLAAARVRPERAGAVLDEAWSALKGEGVEDGLEVTLGAWRLVRGFPAKRAAGRIYGGEAAPRTFLARGALFGRLRREWQDGDRTLLAALVADEAFARLDWGSLEALVRLVNAVERKVVVDLDNPTPRHPLPQQFFDWPREKAEEKHPKETAELRRVLDGWRATLRAHFAEK